MSGHIPRSPSRSNEGRRSSSSPLRTSTPNKRAPKQTANDIMQSFLPRPNTPRSIVAMARSDLSLGEGKYVPASLDEPSRPFTPAAPRDDSPFGVRSQNRMSSITSRDWTSFAEQDWGFTPRGNVSQRGGPISVSAIVKPSTPRKLTKIRTPTKPKQSNNSRRSSAEDILADRFIQQHKEEHFSLLERQKSLPTQKVSSKIKNKSKSHALARANSAKEIAAAAIKEERCIAQKRAEEERKQALLAEKREYMKVQQQKKVDDANIYNNLDDEEESEEEERRQRELEEDIAMMREVEADNLSKTIGNFNDSNNDNDNMNDFVVQDHQNLLDTEFESEEEEYEEIQQEDGQQQIVDVKQSQQKQQQQHNTAAESNLFPPSLFNWMKQYQQQDEQKVEDIVMNCNKCLSWLADKNNNEEDAELTPPLSKQDHELIEFCLLRCFEFSRDKENDTVLKEYIITILLEAVFYCVRNCNISIFKHKTNKQQEPYPKLELLHDELFLSIGILKNFSTEIENKWFLSQGDISGGTLFGEILQYAIFQSDSYNDFAQEDVSKILIESTEVLRNISSVDTAEILFNMKIISTIGLTNYNEMTLISILRSIISPYNNQFQLMFNIARIFGKLSIFQSCRVCLSQDDQSLHDFVSLLLIHHSKLPLCVRVAFTLGNLTVSNDAVRLCLYDKCNAIEVLLASLQRTCDRDAKLLKLKQVHETKDTTTEKDIKKRISMTRDINEYLVKLVRVIANLCINRTIGPQFALRKEISLLVLLLSRKNVKEYEELVLNVISAITNVSYYFKNPTKDDDTTNNILYDHHHQEILAYILPNLFPSNQEIVVESIRAFGNFSRFSEFRKGMMQTRVVEALFIFLEHTDFKILYGACGILLNLASDVTCHSIFFKNMNTTGATQSKGEEKEEENDNSIMTGISFLIQLLDRFMLDNVQLTSVICKIILNLLQGKQQSHSETTTTITSFQETEKSHIIELVNELIAGLEWRDEDCEPELLQLSLSDFLNTLPEEEQSLHEICQLMLTSLQ